ncbi:TolC family protein [Ferruginibacter sp. SUN106]|uniref:TolC family protein n=1 Tax=Ferruginibacter sp. SUN106 TaxID=2978348 RepID=UPI003D36CBDA
MKKFWLTNTAALSMVLLSASAFAQQKNEFTVKQAVDYAMKNATQVKNALLDIKVQEQVNRQITAAAYPQVNASTGFTHYPNIAVQSLPNFISPATYQVLVDEAVKNGAGNTITFPAGGFGNIQAQFGVPWVANAGVDVSQLLFDGQVFVGLMARGAVLDYYKKTAAVTQEQIKANVMKIYYQLVVGQSQLASLDANITRFEKLLNDTKEIYKNGFAEKLDVDKVTVQLNNIKTEKEKVVNALTAGNSGLKFLLGMPQKEQLVLSDTLSEAELKDDILNASYDYKDRKEFQLLTVAEKLGGYNVRRYKLSKLPTVAAFGSYSKNAQRNAFNFFNKDEWFTTSLVGVKISMPLFDGFKKNALIQQSKYELQKTQNSIEQLKQNIDYDVEQSRIKMTSALLTMDNQKKNIVLAESVYNTTKKKYEQGLGNNQEIYNAQTELKMAQTNYYSSLYDAITAKIDWLKAVGKL